ncbi:MAG: hypothetical protein ABI308_13270 [Mucilaginibacter sp.]
MKILLFLMILLSIVIAVPVNGGDKGWFSLYETEFTDAIYMIKTGGMELSRFVIWIMLLIVHLSVICLPFLTTRYFFKELLIFSPLVFVILYAIWYLIIAFLLIPFVIVWIVCLFVYFNTKGTE